MMEVELRNLKWSIKGLKIFGIVITTKKQLENIKYSADELIIKEEDVKLKKKLEKKDERIK